MAPDAVEPVDPAIEPVDPEAIEPDGLEPEEPVATDPDGLEPEEPVATDPEDPDAIEPVLPLPLSLELPPPQAARAPIAARAASGRSEPPKKELWSRGERGETLRGIKRTM